MLEYVCIFNKQTILEYFEKKEGTVDLNFRNKMMLQKEERIFYFLIYYGEYLWMGMQI